MRLSCFLISLAMLTWPAMAPPAAAKTALTPAAVRPVLTTYADIAAAGYRDFHQAAVHLRAVIAALIAAPTDRHLTAARQAWREARVPYQQTEVFRFGNNAVDDWEGKVNAWPLDEGLIDYVDMSGYGGGAPDNPYATANVIAHPLLRIGGRTIDTRVLDRAALARLHELDGVEANVARGYHAIEFLLWGQDLNGTGPGAGARPASDFDTLRCSGGHCARRAAYLRVLTDVLIGDLDDMARAWERGGDVRHNLLTGPPAAGLRAMLTGIGSLSYGELAGERMKLGLLLNDPEEEQDCFSDNTHWSHFFDVVGIQNVYLGRYQRRDGRRSRAPAWRPWSPPTPRPPTAPFASGLTTPWARDADRDRRRGRHALRSNAGRRQPVR